MARSHEVDYEIVGDAMQMLIVELDPGETNGAVGRPIRCKSL